MLFTYLQNTRDMEEVQKANISQNWRHVSLTGTESTRIAPVIFIFLWCFPVNTPAPLTHFVSSSEVRLCRQTISVLTWRVNYSSRDQIRAALLLVASSHRRWNNITSPKHREQRGWDDLEATSVGFCQLQHCYQTFCQIMSNREPWSCALLCRFI